MATPEGTAGIAPREEAEEPSRKSRTNITIKGIVIPYVAIGVLIICGVFFVRHVQFCYQKEWLDFGSLFEDSTSTSPAPFVVILAYSSILFFGAAFAFCFYRTIIKHKWLVER
ncbi:hypothetical protein B9Z55_011432 [Caenorhabditis nigoni]|uniref:Uncharacterized protein n=1 Tax=Caenorhabditis nigoni TaxID=1611254 RepID=A0A2G5UJZ6_9PELO|nr:hypothetical protein B9Z55_011432 [Caenorhabditis nigoni]